MTDLTRTLTAVEVDYLAECEDRIERGLQTFVEVGTALAMIRDNKLFRADHPTFAEYCEKRWGFTDRRARQIIEAAEIGTMVPVENERQARALAGVPEPERADVWQKATESTGGKPTAAAIRDAHAASRPSQPSATAEADGQLDGSGATDVREASGVAAPEPAEAPLEGDGKADGQPVDADSHSADEAPTGSEGPFGAAETAAEGPFDSADADGEEPSSFGSARPAAAGAPTDDQAAGAPVNPADLVSQVLDALVPDDNPHREWQRRFLSDIHAMHRLMRNDVEDVAEKADGQCIEELGRIFAQLDEYRSKVLAALKASTPDNVTPLRRSS
jgi:hypothetical protein